MKPKLSLGGRKTSKMAHSNRQAKKEARGGLTKNQARKSQNSNQGGSSSSRLQETARWVEQNEEKKLFKEEEAKLKLKNKGKDKVVTKEENTKPVYYSRSKNVIERRKSAIKRLEAQLVSKVKPEKDLHELTVATTGSNDVPLTDVDITRIKKELKTLQGRV